jgi:hypothetical protein
MKQLDYRQTAEEKRSIVMDVFPILYKRFDNLSLRSERAAKKCNNYPYYAQMETTLQDSGKWIVFAVFMNKPTQSRGIFLQFHAFQPYEITNAKNPKNNGIGFFYITAHGAQLDVQIAEFPPHLINRMIERLPEQHILSMNISQLCKFILKDNLQGSYTIIRTNKTMKCENQDVPTTVTSTQHGQFLGILPLDNYTCNLTFISNKEMHLSQHAINNFSKTLSIHASDYKDMVGGAVKPEVIEEVLSELGCDEMMDEAQKLLADESRSYFVSKKMLRHTI